MTVRYEPFPWNGSSTAGLATADNPAHTFDHPASKKEDEEQHRVFFDGIVIAPHRPATGTP